MHVTGPSFESIGIMTQAQFAGWVVTRDDLSHYELLNGRVVMTPPAGYPHGLVGASVLAQIVAAKAGDESVRVMDSSQGFELPSGDTVEPDCSVVCGERWAQMPAPVAGKFLRVVPDVLVEIQSPSTASRDRGEKRAIYERSGVREYWLVDPSAREVTVFTAHAGRFDAGHVYRQGETAPSSVLDGLAIDVTALWPKP